MWFKMRYNLDVMSLVEPDEPIDCFKGASPRSIGCILKDDRFQILINKHDSRHADIYFENTLVANTFIDLDKKDNIYGTPYVFLWYPDLSCLCHDQHDDHINY